MPESSTRDASPPRHRRCTSAPGSYLRRGSPRLMKRWQLDKDSMGSKGKESLNNERNSLNQEILMLEKRLHDQFYLRWALENALGYRSTSLPDKDVSPLPKAATELIKEIAVLEVEVLHLERYVLSLYRMAFDRCSNNFSSADMNQCSTLPLTCHEKSVHQDNEVIERQDDFHVPSSTMSVPNYSHSSTNSCHSIGSPRQIDSMIQQNKVSLSRSVSDHDKWNSPSRQDYEHLDGCHSRPRSLAKNMKNSSRTTSLADHLGTSIADHVTETPNRLSEDILRCMSAIYCKLANPHLPQAGLTSSPTSSLSSGSTFSPQDQHDNWSPRCNAEAATNPYRTSELGENNGPYSAMVVVPWIHVDSDRLSYAAQILQKFRSLVQRLEKVDPRKMKHEEKLAFWINIHNALVMHAYLAYGIPTNHSKREPLIVKAAYNVGGQSINACLIQTSILGCIRQTSASWLQTLLSPGSKSRSGNDQHAYAIEHPEPLLHFALSLGGHSDPAVRIYTPKRISKELETAKEEYIQSNIFMRKETRIILPKIIDYYARDAALNLSGLMNVIHDCLSGAQRKALQKCTDGKPPKNVVQFLPYNSVFHYIIHRELAKL
ncbi:uncharacterized protein LOC116246003 isoform X1 [Nymphaea colorata]|nr:uncharacterized protein LOC116246003 isoform X1 [Nymphaea colorata]